MSLIDKLGRKTLLLIGAAGCSTCLAGVAWVFATNSHQSSLLCHPRHLHRVLLHLPGSGHLGLHRRSLSHFRPLQRPGRGLSQPLVHERIDCLEFPVVVHSFHTQTPFAFFAVMTVVQFFVVLFVYPETKGQTLEALQRRLVPGD
jgi:SP family arabinose:H+ symporter-like MFS transporter